MSPQWGDIINLQRRGLSEKILDIYFIFLARRYKLKDKIKKPNPTIMGPGLVSRKEIRLRLRKLKAFNHSRIEFAPVGRVEHDGFTKDERIET